MTISNEAFNKAASTLGVNVAAIKAIAEVESQGNGFYDNGEVKILFERHIFYQRLKISRGKDFADSVYRNSPDICNPVGGGYGKFSEQHPKLRRAEVIDKQCAREACSWGAFQVLGSNWESLGYSSVQGLVNDAFSDDGQLSMLVRFLKANPPIIQAMLAKDWAGVARRYNGPNYKQNNYEIKLADAYKKYGGK